MPKAVIRKPPLRHLVSINDLRNPEVEAIFEAADRYMKALGDRIVPYRIARQTHDAEGRILATLFYEPSTRTRLSFESAMLRLGGNVIASADPQTSSAAKGESLADSVRVVGNYADAIVLRHPRDGAARLAAEYAAVPIINGGDGSHEHPTQTLCDLYTLRREKKKLKNLNVAVSGDLKGSRTIHSFVYALARFGANLILMPAKGMELPAHVMARLGSEFGCEINTQPEHGEPPGLVDALYVTPKEPHQQSLFPDEIGLDIKPRGIDVIYVTRFQRERWQEASRSYVKIDAEFLKGKEFARTRLLHPLPRVGEIDLSLDHDRRAVYFQQAAYGVPVRMALIALLLGLSERRQLDRFETGFPAQDETVYNRPVGVGLACVNPNCITYDELERPHASNRFRVISGNKGSSPHLRCVWCETAVETFALSRECAKTYRMSGDPSPQAIRPLPKDAIIFRTAQDAESAGYHLHNPPARPRERRRSA